MKYLSVCSGIEAATVAWHHMGWKPAGFAEIEKFPSQVLAHHYPDVPNYGDLTQHEKWPIESGSVDLLVGGTPCQSFSVAGLRGGMGDARGRLSLEYLRLASRLRPRWIVWENVPGVLSSGGGRDFGSFLGALGQLGYGWAYRMLDAQYFGVAQRRRRVFVVGYLGDWRRAAAVLFERESLRGDPPARREARQATAAGAGERTAASDDDLVGAIDCRINAQRAQNAASGHLVAAKCITRGEGYRYDFETCTLLPVAASTNTGALTAAYGKFSMGAPEVDARLFVPTVAIGTDCYNGDITGNVAATMGTPGSSVNASGPTVMVAFNARQDSDVSGSVTHPLDTDGHSVAVCAPTITAALALQDISGRDKAQNGRGWNADGAAYTVDSAATQGVVTQTMQVRRLTPRECERLQGFPDGYTDIRLRGKETPDGPRYKALGNSMAVPVMRWIGERINLVESL